MSLTSLPLPIMRRFPWMVLAASCLLVRPVVAQGVTSGVNTFESFLRVAALVGQPATALVPIWPMAIGDGAREVQVQLTGASRLVVRLSAPAEGGATRIEGVGLFDRLPDTLALQRRVTAVHSTLVSRIGAADRCAGAPGAPAFLFAPQQATRLWTRGLQGGVTRLSWSVGGSSGEYALQLQVGAAADAGVDDVYACAARMP